MSKLTKRGNRYGRTDPNKDENINKARITKQTEKWLKIVYLFVTTFQASIFKSSQEKLLFIQRTYNFITVEWTDKSKFKIIELQC